MFPPVEQLRFSLTNLLADTNNSRVSQTKTYYCKRLLLNTVIMTKLLFISRCFRKCLYFLPENMCACLEVKCKQRGKSVSRGTYLILFWRLSKINCRFVFEKARITLNITVQSLIKRFLIQGDRCAIEHEHDVIQDGAEIVKDPLQRIRRVFALVTQDYPRSHRNLHKLGSVLLESSAKSWRFLQSADAE